MAKHKVVVTSFGVIVEQARGVSNSRALSLF